MITLTGEPWRIGSWSGSTFGAAKDQFRRAWFASSRFPTRHGTGTDFCRKDLKITFPKTNIAPEKRPSWPSQKEVHLPTMDFPVQLLVSGRATQKASGVVKTPPPGEEKMFGNWNSYHA